MGREALDATVTAIATRAALAAVAVAAVVILPAVLAGILDHLGRARRLAAVLGCISPPIARRVAASCIAVAIMAFGAGTASAATSGDRRPPSVREWLEGPSSDGPAAPSGTWYPDPADPTGDSGPHGTVDLDDLDARTTTSTAATTSTTQPARSTTTRPPTPRRPHRSRPTTTTTWARFTPPPYAGPRDAESTAPSTGTTPAPTAYTVVPGDCLWTIAAHRLPPTASAAEVDRAWRAIYDANRTVIGSNPDLILPGQVLALPPLPTSA